MVQEICSICKEGKLLSVKKEEHVEVKEFSCGHKIEKIESTWVKGFVLLDPVTDLKQAISRRAWFEGIVIATTYFEWLGIRKLKNYFESEGITIGSNRIERLNLGELIVFLYGCSIIDYDTYTKMFKVKHIRDDLVHQPEAKYELQDRDAERLIKKALECVKALGVS